MPNNYVYYHTFSKNSNNFLINKILFVANKPPNGIQREEYLCYGQLRLAPPSSVQGQLS